MGLFSGIKKIGKKIFKGVKKVFKKVGKFVGKVLNSKLGKILLLAASIVTGGLALAASIGAFTGQAAGATLLTKFVAGAKAFTGAMMNPVGAGKGALGGLKAGGGLAGAAQGAAAGQGVFNVGLGATAAEKAAAGVNAATGGLDAAVTAATGTAEGAGAAGVGAATGAAPGAGAVAAPSVAAPTAAATAAPGVAAPAAQTQTGVRGLLSSSGNFLKSEGGQGLLSSAVKGWAQGQMAEDERRWNERFERAWADPKQMQKVHDAAGTRANIPGGYLDRARQLDKNFEQRLEQTPTELGPAYAESFGGT